MKAAIYKKYGSPDVIQIKEAKKTTPKPNEVLVKIHASSINSWDWDMLTGKPRLYRLLFGLFKPKYNILGIDIAGTIESCGTDTNQFKPGDEIFGDISEINFGGFSEYICVPEHLLVLKSPKMSFEQAAALPHVGLLAIQCIQQFGEIKPNVKVLINGAGGGVGSIAIPYLKQRGAEITCVDKAIKEEYLKKLGANHFIDYTKSKFVNENKKYDYIIDNKATFSSKQYASVLNDGGIYAASGGAVSCIMKMQFAKKRTLKRTGKTVGLVIYKPNQKDLTKIRDLFEQGIIQVHIDKVYALENIREAFEYFGSEDYLGKVAVKVV